MRLIPCCLLFAMLGATVSAQAASVDCVAPVFPEQSVSSEGVRRVEKQVKNWNTCYAASKTTSADAVRLNEQIGADHEKWQQSTRNYASGQARSQETVSADQRTRDRHLAALRKDNSPSQIAYQNQ